MGMKAVRMSRKDHPMPTMKATSARVAAKYSDDQRPRQPEKPHSVHSMVPIKHRPSVDLSMWTPPPPSYAQDGKKEGPVRGRQADKSSKSK